MVTAAVGTFWWGGGWLAGFVQALDAWDRSHLTHFGGLPQKLEE